MDNEEKPDGDTPKDERPLVERAHRFDRTRREAYIDLLRKGIRRRMAARAAKVSPTTVAKHMREDPAFAEEVRQAELESIEAVESALFRAAVTGDKIAATIFFLTNRAPDSWSDKRAPTTLHVSGPDGGPIRVDHSVEELRERATAALQKIEAKRDRVSLPASPIIEDAEVIEDE